MQRTFGIISAMAMLMATIFVFGSEAAAQRPNEKRVRDTARSLNSKVDDLEYALMFRLRSISAGRQEVNDANSSVMGLKEALRSFDESLNQRRDNPNNIHEIVRAANDVQGFLRAHPQDARIESVWRDIQGLVDSLAANYGVTPDWRGRISSAPSTGTTYDPISSPAASGPLTGTYRLDRGRSENIDEIINYSGVSGANRGDLQSKLESPEELALSVRGNRVSLASSNGSVVNFIADGREETEVQNGRTVRMRATLGSDELTVSSLGGESDYTIVFSSMPNGLKVTRRVTTPYLAETVFAESVYSKTSSVAGLGINDGYLDDDEFYPDRDTDTGYSSNVPDDNIGINTPNPTMSSPRIGQFIVPDGMVLMGNLETAIDTDVSQNNDRFRMIVQSPMEYRGAVVEGYITGVGSSGRVSGRPNVTFNFERITLAGGRAYDFAGNLESIKDHQGKDVRVGTEGTAEGDSQTRETVKRGGLGAGLGAVIGAIAGGAKGAAIGAIIGGAGGAGSVLVGGRDDVKLLPGSTLTVRSSSPVR
jgi:hypothetical protein